MSSSSSPLLIALLCGLFVLLWSTGFIGAVWGLPYAEPWTFLTLRFGIVVAVTLPFALIFKFEWPRSWRQVLNVALVGLFMHGIYLGCAFVSMSRGLPAGLSALLAALQPLFAAVLVGPFLGERVSVRQLTGFFLGLAGVALVLSEKLEGGATVGYFEGFDLWAVIFGLGAPLAMTAAVVIQKRFNTAVDIKSGTLIQYGAAFVFALLLSLLFEERSVEWNGDFIFALGWLVVMLSFGAVSLLMLLLRLGEAGRTSSLFYLVPPVTALEAYLFFGDTLTPLQLLGMAIAVLGVALVVLKFRAH